MAHFKTPGSFQDIYFMNIAINLSRTGVGSTGSNPSVGTVIVSHRENKGTKNEEPEIISRAITNQGGKPHSEDLALKQAGEKAKGAVMYVTLEPCAHYGNTAPCVEAIIAAGIKRVVIAVKDPDERVNGRGIEILKQSGIAITENILAKEAALVNIGYFYRKLYNMPFITLKIATTLDGKIALSNGESKWITNAQARKFAHKIRSQNDAIMIGKGTLKADNPSLECLLPGLEGGKKIILDSIGNIKELNNNEPTKNGFKIFSQGEIFLMGAKNNFSHPNVKNIETPVKGTEVELEPLVKKLAEIGINNLLIEGGCKLATNLLKNNLIDKIIWFRSDTIAGNKALPVFDNLAIEKLENLYQFNRSYYATIGNNTVEFLERSPPLNIL